MHGHRTLVGHMVVCLAAAAPGLPLCGQEVERVDSAGIEIVHHTGTPRAPAWPLDARADLQLGGMDSDLWQIRAVTQTMDGGLVVVSGGTFRVHVFDQSGTEVAAFGGRGQGPCEFVHPTTVTLVAPDTLLILDRDAVDIFLLDGRCVGSRPTRPIPNGFGAGVMARPTHVLPGGSVVLTGSAPPGNVPYGEPFRLALYLGLRDADGGLRVAGRYRGVSQERVDVPGGNPIVVPPFARNSSIVVVPEAPLPIAAADNADFEIHLFDGRGALARIIRRDTAPVRVRDSWVDAWKARQRARGWTAAILPRLERQWVEMTVPETLPAFERIALDVHGAVCVQRPVIDYGAPLVFDIFGGDGVLIGEIELPAGMTHTPWIGDEVLLSVWEDGLGVETVRRYRFRRLR